MSAYLFVHFTSDSKGDKEHIWFSISYDGLNWQDLGSNEPVITAKSGTKGIRDPYILYDEKTEKYVMIATDLNTKGGNWHKFSHRGSRSLFVWESTDLINWSEERLVKVGIKGAGCVWAPEAVFCKEKDAWFVFWASNVKEKGELHHKQRIYGSFTKDFKDFTPAFKYIDAETAIIDTTITWCDGFYYRFSKDETNKIIIVERSKSLVDGEYERIPCKTLDNFYGLEGPEIYYLDQQQKWCLIADNYHGNHGYLPFLTDDLSSGDFVQVSPDQYDMGKRKKRHGGVIKIDDKTAEKLVETYKISGEE